MGSDTPAITIDANEDETLAFNALTGLGLTVSRVPPSKDKTPDFVANDPLGGRYMVEVKSRKDPETFSADLTGGRLATATVRLDNHHTVAAALKKAASQLKARRTSDADVLLVCYVMDGFSPLMQAEQLMATLWGTAKLFDIDEQSYSAPCYYFGQSAFADNPEIDGVLTLVPSLFSMGLYPNRFSARRIEDSFLGRTAQGSFLFSPESVAERGSILLADPALPDIPSRLRDIQKRTGRRRLSPMMSAGFQSAFSVRVSDL